jgi:hypothetical protein
MAEEMDQMGERPPIDSAMDTINPVRSMPEEARTNLMRPSDEIGAVLVARLSNMSDEELSMLDDAITPQVAKILIKLLPELGKIIDAVGQMPTSGDQMGALGNM